MHSFVELIALFDLTGLALTVARSHATLAPQLTPQLLHSCFAAPCALASSRLLRSLIVAPPSAPQQPFVRHSPIRPCLELTVQTTCISGFSYPGSTVSSHPRLPIHRRPMQPCLEPRVPIFHKPRVDCPNLQPCMPVSRRPSPLVGSQLLNLSLGPMRLFLELTALKDRPHATSARHRHDGTNNGPCPSSQAVKANLQRHLPHRPTASICNNTDHKYYARLKTAPRVASAPSTCSNPDR